MTNPRIWTAPAVDRGGFPVGEGERESLELFLDYHRATLLTKCAGLTGEQLARRAVPPSGLSLLGLVRHMAEVEMWWFRLKFGRNEDLPLLFCGDVRDGDFDLVDPARAEEDYATFVREVGLARETAAGRSLDEYFPGLKRPLTLRWLYLHMIQEYARHNGHADLLREAIDGVTGD